MVRRCYNTGPNDMSDTETYLTAPQVRKRYNVTDMSLWRWQKNPDLGFPAPMVINRRRYWRECDLVEWERKQAARAA